MVLASYPDGRVEQAVADSIDFMIERVCLGRLCADLPTYTLVPPCRSCWRQCLVRSNLTLEQLEKLDRKQLASRMVLHVSPGYVEPQSLQEQGIKVRHSIQDASLTSAGHIAGRDGSMCNQFQCQRRLVQVLSRGKAGAPQGTL